MSPSSFNLQFWLLTLGLVAFWTVVLSAASPSMDSNQKQLLLSEKESRMHERNCKALCKHCGCMGFYCGEECICECNNENSNTECLESMQSNAQKLNIPFQLLIQGPSRNRFVRDALQYSLDRYGFAAPVVNIRDKRSTALIYKPAAENSLQSQGNDAHKLAKSKDESSQRQKRAVGQLDWFSDIANTLVRPAPLSNKKRFAQPMHSAEEVAQSKRGAKRNEMDRSWFADNPSLLLRPAPLFKRQRKQSERDTGESTGRFNDDLDSYESPMRAVEKLPKVLKETLRNLQETAIGGDVSNDFGGTLRSQIKEGANVLHSQLSESNLDFLPANGAMRDNIQQTLSQIFTSNTDNNRHFPLLQRSTSPKGMAKHKLTWFRPVRFLQRVQQAID